MEKDDLIRDDVLGRLISKTNLDSPSGEFTGNVMESLRPGTVTEPAKKPFFLFVKSSWPWFLLGIFVLGFLFTYDFPYFKLVAEKKYFGADLVPYYESLFRGMKNMFTGSKAVSLTLLLIFAGGILYGLDLLLDRKLSARHHTS